MFFCSRTVTSRAQGPRDETPRAGMTAAAGPLAADRLAAATTGGDQAVTVRSHCCEGRDALRAAGLAGLQRRGPLCTVSKDLTPGAGIVTATPRRTVRSRCACRPGATAPGGAPRLPRPLRTACAGRATPGPGTGRARAPAADQPAGRSADRLDDGLVQAGERGEVLPALPLEPRHHRRVLVHPALPLVQPPRLEDLGVIDPGH